MQLFIIMIYSTFHNVHLIWLSVKSSQNSNIPYKMICAPREVSNFLRFWLLLFRTQNMFPWFVIVTSPKLTLSLTQSEMTLRCNLYGIIILCLTKKRVILERVRLISSAFKDGIFWLTNWRFWRGWCCLAGYSVWDCSYQSVLGN